jgi:F-type H+-transporting ATPase subunit b
MAHHETAVTVDDHQFEEAMVQAMDGDPHTEAWYMDPTPWVAAAFVLFVIAMLYYKVPKLIAKVLDDRAEGIASQLEEARKLREEAQTLLASYERQQRDAEGEAQEILDHAKVEAERAMADAKVALEETIVRREALAQDKITQAEATAVKEVRDVAVEVAVATARILVAENLQSDQADALVDKSIAELGQHLN